MKLERYFSDLLDQQAPDLEQSEANWDRRADEVSTFTVDTDDVALRLIQAHMTLQGKSVLDVSFGAGRYLLEFLRRGAQVSGVEISSGMVRQAQQKLQSAGLPHERANLVHSAWEALDLEALGWNEKFDLVFLHMSPAISSTAMLRKVLAATRHAVCISLYVQREDSLLQDLLIGFGLQQQPAGVRTANDLYAIFNLLYLWGYFPQLEFEERSRTRHHEPEHIFERYASWLWRGADGTEVRRKALKNTLLRRSIGGKVSTISRDIIGHLLLDTTTRVSSAQE